MEKTKFVTRVDVVDPDTNQLVTIEIRKCLESGAMIGIDGSFLEQDVDRVRNPYNDGFLDIPDDEGDK